VGREGGYSIVHTDKLKFCIVIKSELTCQMFYAYTRTYFIWQLLVVAACWLLYYRCIAQSADCPHAQWN
jgi:hypothetical protein